jgi:hypothetical protein
VSTVIEMPIEKWASVEDNPRQRDTEMRAQRAKHLFKFSPDHATVMAARLPSGKLIKLDGHTRTFLWQNGSVQGPETVRVVTFDVADMDEAKELYTHFDSDKAVERGNEKISGAFREYGLNPQSALLRSGRIANALRVARRALGMGQSSDVYEIMGALKKPIKLLDSLMLNKHTFPTGMVAAIIITTARYGEDALPFWRAVLANAGSKIDGEMDGVQACYELQLHAQGKYGESAVQELAQRALSAFEKWRDKTTLRQMPRPINLRKYMNAA